jgi:hypothetical protein
MQTCPWSNRRYGPITLDEVFLSYAGKFLPGDSVPTALAAAEVDDPVRFHVQGNHVYLLTDDGIAIAELSAAGREKWLPRLAQIHHARIIGMNAEAVIVISIGHASLTPNRNAGLSTRTSYAAVTPCVPSACPSGQRRPCGKGRRSSSRDRGRSPRLRLHIGPHHWTGRHPRLPHFQATS